MIKILRYLFYHRLTWFFIVSIQRIYDKNIIKNFQIMKIQNNKDGPIELTLSIYYKYLSLAIFTLASVLRINIVFFNIRAIYFNIKRICFIWIFPFHSFLYFTWINIRILILFVLFNQVIYSYFHVFVIIVKIFSF